MDRNQLALSLLLAVPVGFGVFLAVQIRVQAYPFSIGAGLLTAALIFGLLVLAVEYEPPLPEE